jgi:hypothetical protein
VKIHAVESECSKFSIKRNKVFYPKTYEKHIEYILWVFGVLEENTSLIVICLTSLITSPSFSGEVKNSLIFNTVRP